jgi:hypothetical protein
MIEFFLQIFKNLLPRSRAFSIIIEKRLREWFVGLADLPADIREYFQLILLDLFPDTTRTLENWESEFGIQPVGTELDRRQRLDAAWKAIGGQSPRYLQDIFQAAGFDVYVHEPWFIDGFGIKRIRNPNLYIDECAVDPCFVPTFTAGNQLAIAGYFGAIAGASSEAKGYLLVNKIREVEILNIFSAGSSLAIAGNSNAVAAASTGVEFSLKEYTIPADQNEWPYIAYIGGETFPELASVPASRRKEFEALVLRYCPSQLWLGMLINYTT